MATQSEQELKTMNVQPIMEKSYQPSIYMIVAVIMISLFIITFIVKISWNYVLPAATGVREITLLQAFALLVLCGVLFGGQVSMRR